MKNPLDAAINFFSPERGLRRARARYAQGLMARLYDGASFGRRGSAWRARHTSANAELSQALRALRDRSRELVRNTPHAPRMLEVLVSSAVGIGLTPVCKTGSDTLDKRVLQMWDDWAYNADVTGAESFYGMQALACRSMIESGEVVFRFIDRRLNAAGRQGKVPLQLQCLESDQIDMFREGIYSLAEGAPPGTYRSRMGVGLGEFDFHTGLWILPWHPGEVTTYNMRPAISEFIPADEVLHVYKMLRPGQVRGVPWFAPVLTTAREMADYMDAVNVKARIEACFAGFILNSTDAEQLVPTDPDPTTGDPVTTLEPGMLRELKAGQDIKFAAPTSTGQIEPVILFNLMAMAAGVGVTYDQATGDLRQANYSSLRAGKIEFRRQVEQLQHLVLIPKLCNPVWKRFIDRAILAGYLEDRKDGYPVQWVTPSWEPIDPRKDLQAEILSLRAGRTTPQAFTASWGHDYRKVVDDWAEALSYADEKGVKFDFDPRNFTQSGIQQAKPGDPAGADNAAGNASQADIEDAVEDAAVG